MTEVGLGEKVDSVRAKVGLGDTDLLNAWRTVNTKAREISREMNGNVPSKQANTYSTIEELKKYFAEPKDGGDDKARLKIVHALKVKGAAAWIVHNAVKRNYDKYRKATQLWSVPEMQPANSGPGKDAADPGSARTPTRDAAKTG